MVDDSATSTAFPNAGALGAWLSENSATHTELWVRIFKTGSGVASVTWTDCVIEAIRFGWIDGQKWPLDEVSFLQRLTPRKPRSNWSAKNREHATRLVEEGRMTSAGLAHVEAAQADGRWASAYDGQAAMVRRHPPCTHAVEPIRVENSLQSGPPSAFVVKRRARHTYFSRGGLRRQSAGSMLRQARESDDTG